MSKMFVIQLKALLNAVYKFIDYEDIFLLGDHLNLLNNSYLQSSNGIMVALAPVVIEELQEVTVSFAPIQWPS